jgi:hypothetical protein
VLAHAPRQLRSWLIFNVGQRKGAMVLQLLAAFVVVVLFAYVAFGVSLALRTGTVRYFWPRVFKRKSEPSWFWFTLAAYTLFGVGCLYYAIGALSVFFA